MLKAVFMVALGGALAASSPATPPGVILDTDMLSDYDDVGAMACLHALADAGECRILATVSCTRGNASVAVVEVINAYYGRGWIPVGCAKEIGVIGESIGMTTKVDPLSPVPAHWGGHNKYRRLAAEYPQWVRHLDSDTAPDANDVYRRALASAPDCSVVICSLGFFTNLRRLLETPPDAISPLDGPALIRRKVRRLVSMSCSYPDGREYNAQGDPESSRIVLENWPTEIVFSDFQYGMDIFAGRAVAESEAVRNPVKDLFAGSLPSRAAVNADPVGQRNAYVTLAGRSAWDETAVLMAVRGPEPYCDVVRGRYEMIGNSDADRWTPQANGPHMRIVERVKKEQVGRVIDELICRKPRLLPQSHRMP